MAPRASAPEEPPSSNASDRSLLQDVEMADNTVPHMTSQVALSPRRGKSAATPNSSEMEGLLHQAPLQPGPPRTPTRGENLDNNSNNNSNTGTGGVAASASALSASILQSKAAVACMLYSVCSVAMVLTNKSLASSYSDKTKDKGIDLNILLVVFQAIVAVLCVEFSKRMQWVEYPQLTAETVKLWIPVNLFFCSMLFTGMASLQHNSVPMVTIFKNITNIIVASGDVFFFHATVEALVIASFAVTMGGAVAAAWNDLESSPIGLFWMAANCCSTAGYVLYMKYATKHVKLSKFGMVFINNLLCVVFLLPVAMLRGEVMAFFQTSGLHTMDYFGKNMLAGFMGFFLNFAALNCVAATGPTTYAVVGSLNKVPVAFLGYFMFDSAISPETWFFICISLCGGFLYSYAKIRQTK